MLALENVIVSVVGIDGNTHVERRTFKGIKGIDGVGGIQGDLEFNMDVPRCGINKDATTLVWFSPAVWRSRPRTLDSS